MRRVTTPAARVTGLRFQGVIFISAGSSTAGPRTESLAYVRPAFCRVPLRGFAPPFSGNLRDPWPSRRGRHSCEPEPLRVRRRPSPRSAPRRPWQRAGRGVLHRRTTRFCRRARLRSGAMNDRSPDGETGWARRSRLRVVPQVKPRKLAKVPFVEMADGRLQGVVSSGSEIGRVYVSSIAAGTHDYNCSTNNNRPCGGLCGSPCKHLRALCGFTVTDTALLGTMARRAGESLGVTTRGARDTNGFGERGPTGMRCASLGATTRRAHGANGSVTHDSTSMRCGWLSATTAR